MSKLTTYMQSTYEQVLKMPTMWLLIVTLAWVTRIGFSYPSYYAANSDCEQQRIKTTTVFANMGPDYNAQPMEFDDSLRLPCPAGTLPMIWRSPEKSPLTGDGIQTTNCISYCQENNGDCFPDDTDYDQLVCAKSGQATAKVHDKQRSDYTVCIVGCGLAGTTAAALASSIPGNHLHACTNEYLHASSQSSGVLYFPNPEDTEDLITLAQLSVDTTPEDVKNAFDTSLPQYDSALTTSLRKAFLTHWTQQSQTVQAELSSALDIEFVAYPGPEYMSSRKRSYTTAHDGTPLQGTAGILVHLKTRSTIPLSDSTTVTNYAWANNQATLTFENGSLVTCEHAILATGGFGQNTQIPSHRSITNNGVAWTGRDPQWNISEPWLAWHMEETLYANGTFSSIRWFQEQDNLFPDPDTPGFMNLMNANEGYIARADYNRRALALWASSAVTKTFSLYARSEDGEYTFQHLSPDMCSPPESAEFWGNYMSNLLNLPVPSCDPPVKGTATDFVVRPMIIDTKSSVLTDNDSHHLDPNVHVYYIGNAGAWPFGSTYFGPGNTLGFCMYSAWTATQRIANTIRTTLADAPPSLVYFIVAVGLFTAGIAVISVFPWLDRAYKLSREGWKTYNVCDTKNSLPGWAWTTAAVVHGILMTLAFVFAVLGIMEVASAPENAKINVKRETHGTVGYWSLLFFVLQILFGWPLVYLVTRLEGTFKVKVVAAHAVQGFVLAGLILYQTKSGYDLTVSSTLYDEPNLVAPIYVVVIISIVLSVINLVRWYQCQAYGRAWTLIRLM